MNYIFKNFIFNHDVVIANRYDSETDTFYQASNSEYKLRNLGCVIFNASVSGIPLIEICVKIRESGIDETFDPLLSMVMGDLGDGYRCILYFSSNDGENYIELAIYENMFAGEYNSLLVGLAEYREGGDLDSDTMNGLKSLLGMATTFIQDKIDYIRKI
jgi:hypothetical protein